MGLFRLTLNITQDTHVLASNEVDGDTLATESARTTDAMDVILTVAGEVVVDDQANLLNVDTPSPHVGRNKHSAVALSEILHNTISLLLGHITVHAADGEVGFAHLIGQPVDLPAGIAENNSLGNSEGVVEIAKGIEFPVFLLHSNEVLLEAFEGQLITLDQDTDGVGHELRGHVEHIVREGGRDDNDLCGRRKIAVHIVDLLAETLVEELIGFIENQHLDVSGAKMAAANHIGNTARGAGHNVLTIVELANILSNVGTTNASMALDVHVVSQRHDNALNLGRKFAGRGKDEGLGLADGGVDNLKHRNRESGCFAGTGLGLGDGVATLADLNDGAGLDSGRRLVSVGVDTTKERLCFRDQSVSVKPR